MASTPPSSEPTPIIEILQRFLEGGIAHSKNESLTRDGLQTWNSLVRNQLQRIWGKNAPAMAYFATLPQQLTSGEVRRIVKERAEHLQRIIERLQSLVEQAHTSAGGDKIFIGHGRSLQWLVLKDFIADRLHLQWEEFNRAPAAGYTTIERLEQMLSNAAFALLVMTAEEEHADSSLHARGNVIHEIGLFQGSLGAHRAIVLLEEGCSEFSNIVGLTQIRFPRSNIIASFEEVRRVLERERILYTS